MLICSGMRSRRLGRAILGHGHMVHRGVVVEDGHLYEGVTVPRVSVCCSFLCEFVLLNCLIWVLVYHSAARLRKGDPSSFAASVGKTNLARPAATRLVILRCAASAFPAGSLGLAVLKGPYPHHLTRTSLSAISHTSPWTSCTRSRS